MAGTNTQKTPAINIWGQIVDKASFIYAELLAYKSMLNQHI